MVVPRARGPPRPDPSGRQSSAPNPSSLARRLHPSIPESRMSKSHLAHGVLHLVQHTPPGHAVTAAAAGGAIVAGKAAVAATVVAAPVLLPAAVLGAAGYGLYRLLGGK